jgi:hypothetical protein
VFGYSDLGDEQGGQFFDIRREFAAEFYIDMIVVYASGQFIDR